MNNFLFCNLLLEVIRTGTLRWYMNSGATHRSVILGKNIFDGYKAVAEGYCITFTPQERRNEIWQPGNCNIKIAIGLEVRSLNGSLVCSMTSDPDIFEGDIREPSYNYLIMMYLYVRRSWFKWVDPKEFAKIYPVHENGYRGIYPVGLSMSEVFSSKPVMERL